MAPLVRSIGFLLFAFENNVFRIHFPQIPHCPVWFVRDQFLEGRSAGCRRQHSGANRACTTNVEGRIANHQHLASPEWPLQEIAASIAGDRCDAVAFFVIVGKSPGLKIIPQAQVTQLDLGAQTDIAGEQARHRWLLQGLALLHKADHSLANLALALPQNLVQPKYVSGKEPVKVLWSAGDPVETKKLPHQAYICPPGELQFLEAIGRVEL